MGNEVGCVYAAVDKDGPVYIWVGGGRVYGRLGMLGLFLLLLVTGACLTHLHGNHLVINASNKRHSSAVV